MTQNTAARLARCLLVLSIVLLVAQGILSFANENGPKEFFDFYFLGISVVAALAFATVGTLIVSTQPGNTIGWLFIATTMAFAIWGLSTQYALFSLGTSPGTLPGGRIAAWIGFWTIAPMISVFVPIFLLFPDGRVPSRRWRPVLWVLVAAITIQTLAFAVKPGLIGVGNESRNVDFINPFGIHLKSAIGFITAAAGITTFVVMFLAAAALIVRFRRAGSEVRQQIKWILFVGLAFIVEFVIGNLAVGFVGEKGPAANLVGNLSFTIYATTLIVGLPVAVGFAILKYKLYSLDIIVRKTVVLGLLAVFITIVYAGIVGVVGAMIGSTGSTTASFVAAAVLAVLFQPARDRARKVADRLVYGKRATPYEVLAEFSGTVGEAYGADDVLPKMAEVLAAGTGAASATIWLRIGSNMRAEAVWPSDVAPPSVLSADATEVHHQGELLGALSVEMPPSDPMNPARDKLVQDLAAQAGLVLRNVRLIEELRASRQRLVAAQDAERRKIERNLHDGAQQNLVALAVKLRLAEQLVLKDTDKTAEILSQLQSETTDAIENLRDLARGIYPPLLADQGLAAALEAQAGKASVPTSVNSDGIGRHSQDIEAAVYFCTLEALQNVTKYANASHASIDLSTTNGTLTFTVTDDGDGFDTSSTSFGTGLQGMADRLDAIGGTLTITSATGEGTTVTGRVPLDRQ